MKKYLKTILIALVLLSTFAFLYSLTLKPYTNESEFEEKYLQLSSEDGSRKYWDLRDSYLTEKYAMQEFSLVLLLISVLLIMVVHKKEIKSPSSKMILFFWGVIASCTYTFWYVASIIVDQMRGAFAHWADSIAIPLMSASIMLIVLLFLFTLHTFFRYRSYTPSYNLKMLRIKDFKSYFGFISILNIVLIILSICTAWTPEPSLGFVLVLFMVISLYFNLSLLKNKNKLDRVN
ncbi:MAG: hypothetical protein RL094_740 [Candidatus Parcubacteria bacterium]|jgi:hypothetical protein